MRYTFKRYWLWILLLVGGILILSFLISYDLIELNVFVAGAATLITLFISVINYYHHSDKFFKELFTEFNSRYDTMNNFLMTVSPNTKLESDEKQKVIDYLNLCAEEYMWVKKGRIPEHIWNSWKNGIETYLKNPAIKEVFDQERALWKSSYYGFFDQIN